MNASILYYLTLHRVSIASQITAVDYIEACNIYIIYNCVYYINMCIYNCAYFCILCNNNSMSYNLISVYIYCYFIMQYKINNNNDLIIKAYIYKEINVSIFQCRAN